jgi:hypothetical protein
VTAKQRQDAGLDGRFMNKLTHVRGEFNKPARGRLDVQMANGLVHRIDSCLAGFRSVKT